MRTRKDRCRHRRYADGERSLRALLMINARGISHHRAGRPRGAGSAHRRRPPRFAQRNPQARALCARQSSVTLDDVDAVVADASSLAFDAIADAAFAGKALDVQTHYSKARGAGTLPNVIAGSALRQVLDLHRADLAIEAGEPMESAMGSFRPAVHFRRKPFVEAALRAWSSVRLASAMQQLASAANESRRKPALGDAIVERALLAVAQSARRRD